jgi:hypothetical protein
MTLGELRGGPQQPIGSPTRKPIPFIDAEGGSDDPRSPKTGFFFHKEGP